MSRRQTIPEQWLIIEAGTGERLRKVRRLPRGSGVLFLCRLIPSEGRWLRSLAHLRRLTVLHEGARTAVRVHNIGELRRALLRRAPLILLSPLYPTRSHTDWRPFPRMRAAALARLASRKVIALGGMDERRFRLVRDLGFVGWAGISAWSRRQVH